MAAVRQAIIPARQASFWSGEVSPLFYGRTDHPRYGSALRRLINFIALPQGPAQNRPGTKWIAATKDPTQKSIYVPFVFSSSQAYALEFGNLYVRFDQSGAPVVSGGVPYEIVTPFTTAMLPYLKFSQSGDILSICYGGQDTAAIAPQELRRLGHTNWTIGAASFAPPVAAGWGGIGAPVIVISGSAPDATHQAKDWQWQFTQLLRENATGNLFETLPTNVSRLAWDVAASYSTGDAVEYPGGSRILYTSLTNANLGNQPDTSPASWVRGIVVGADRVRGITWALAVPAGYTLEAVNAYRGRNDAYGFIGNLAAGSPLLFVDDGAEPDFSIQPPKGTNPFAKPASDYPSCVAYFEQRRVFGRQVSHPLRIQGSRPGQRGNFDVDLFVEADDAVSFDLAADQLDDPRSLIHLRSLIALTQSGAYSIRGFQGDPLTPSSIDAKRIDGASGASWVNPAIVRNTVIYEHDGGSAVSGLIYDPDTNASDHIDLSIIAEHLLRGKTLTFLAYAHRPFRTIWAGRSDGVLLGVTYLPGNPPVIAWHQHQLGGSGVVESGCVIPEGTEDVLYLQVKRGARRDKERFTSRNISDVRLGVFLDAAITADGRNVGAVTMKFTSDTTYLGGEEGTILASANSFVADTDVGDQIVFDPDGTAGGPYRLTVIGVTDATHVRATLDQPLPAAFQAVASTSWGWARDVISGLDHLEGKTVNVLADGAVQGPFLVTGGIIWPMSPPAVIAQIGLPYTSTMELLDLAQAREKQKRVVSAVVELVESRGLKVGEPDATATKAEWDDQRTVEVGYGPIPMFTGQVRLRIESGFNEGGRIAVVQEDPLPCTVVAVTRELIEGGAL